MDHSKNKEFYDICYKLILGNACFGDYNECWMNSTESNEHKLEFNLKGRKPHYILWDKDTNIVTLARDKNRMYGQGPFDPAIFVNPILVQIDASRLDEIDTHKLKKDIKKFK